MDKLGTAVLATTILKVREKTGRRRADYDGDDGADDDGTEPSTTTGSNIRRMTAAKEL